MIKFLGRAVRLSRRVLFASVLIGMAKNLDELVALVRHPQYIVVPENMTTPEMQRLVERLRSSGGAGPLRPWPSSSASRFGTPRTTTTTAPTAGTGKSDQTSGATGEDFVSAPTRRMQAAASRISSPTPATKPEGGSHGPAPASSTSGPDKHACGLVHDTRFSSCTVARDCDENGHRSLDFGGGCRCGRNQEFVRFHATAVKPMHNHWDSPTHHCWPGCPAYEDKQVHVPCGRVHAEGTPCP